MDAWDGEIDLLIILIFAIFGWKFGTQNEQIYRAILNAAWRQKIQK